MPGLIFRLGFRGNESLGISIDDVERLSDEVVTCRRSRAAG